MSKVASKVVEELGYAIAHRDQHYFLTPMKRTRDQAINEAIDTLWGKEFRKDKYLRLAYWVRAKDEGWYVVRTLMTTVTA